MKLGMGLQLITVYLQGIKEAQRPNQLDVSGAPVIIINRTVMVIDITLGVDMEQDMAMDLEGMVDMGMVVVLEEYWVQQ